VKRERSSTSSPNDRRRALIDRIGERLGRSAGRVTFETRNARETAVQVRRELLARMNTATRTEHTR
jgi:hypothetical protein